MIFRWTSRKKIQGWEIFSWFNRFCLWCISTIGAGIDCKNGMACQGFVETLFISVPNFWTTNWKQPLRRIIQLIDFSSESSSAPILKKWVPKPLNVKVKNAIKAAASTELRRKSWKKLVGFRVTDWWSIDVDHYIWAPFHNTLRIQVCPKKRISPTILFWRWDFDHQSYSRERFGFLGIDLSPTQKGVGRLVPNKILKMWMTWTLKSTKGSPATYFNRQYVLS